MQRLRNTGVDVLNRSTKYPCPPILDNQTTFDDVPPNRHHEQGVSAGVAVYQSRELQGQIVVHELFGEVLRYFEIFEALNGDFVAQMANQ